MCAHPLPRPPTPQVGWVRSEFPSTALCHRPLGSVRGGPGPGPQWAVKRGQTDPTHGLHGTVGSGPSSLLTPPLRSPSRRFLLRLTGLLAVPLRHQASSHVRILALTVFSS